jgi:hypothetical protein
VVVQAVACWPLSAGKWVRFLASSYGSSVMQIGSGTGLLRSAVPLGIVHRYCMYCWRCTAQKLAVLLNKTFSSLCVW